MSDNPEETVNYLRFIAFYIDVATEIVLEVFNHLIETYKGTSTIEFLSSSEVKGKITRLRKGKVINKKNFNLLNANVPNARKFDISLLITLITNTGLLHQQEKDFQSSLKADFARLRDIRNSTIAHKPKAALYKDKFQKLWVEVEDILTRLNKLIDPETSGKLSKKISDYRNRSFSDQDDRVYRQKIEESREEMSRLQNKMEELSLKCNEFTTFFRKAPEKYSRYVQLLFEGGKLVLINVLSKGLAEASLDIKTVLYCNRNEIERNTDSIELLREVFTKDEAASTHTNIDTNTWDIILLAEVIEVSLDLNYIQKEEVRIIKDARKNYAETALKSITDIQRFYECCEDLVSSIKVLSYTLDNDIQIKCHAHISRYKAQSTEQEFTNYEDYLNQLKAHGTDIKNLSELHKETSQKLKDCVKEMKESGINFINEHVLNLKIITLGERNDKKRLAENVLETVWQAALAKSDNPAEFGAVREEVEKILKVLQQIPNVKADNMERECIIHSITCFSCQTLLDVVDYLSGDLFNEHLFSLASELSFVCDEVIAVEGNITFESLSNISSNSGSEASNNGLATDNRSLPVVCFSPEGMQSVLEFVNSESFTNSINVIADSLSSYVEETISLKVIPDCKELTGIIEETSDDSKAASSSCSHEAESDYSDRFQRKKFTEKESNSISFNMNNSNSTNQTENASELPSDDLLAEDTRHTYGEVNTKERNIAMACSNSLQSSLEKEKNCKLTNFFRDLLKNHISFKISRDETKDIVHAVETLVSDIVWRVARNVEWLGPYEKLRILKVGSMAERTSISYPDEFDFLIVTHQDGVQVERKCKWRQGYAHVKVTDGRLQTLWKPFLRGEYLQGSFSHDFFGKVTEVFGYAESVCRKLVRKDPLQHQTSDNILDPYHDSLAHAFMSEVAKVVKIAGDLRCCRNSGTLRVNKHVVNHGPAFMPTFTWEPKNGKKARIITVDMTLAIEVNISRCGNVIAENETFHSKVWRNLSMHGKYMLIPCNESVSCVAGFCFRLTFTETEAELVRGLSDHHKECYRLLKYVFNSGGGHSYLPSYAFKMLVLKHNFFCRETANLALCFKEILASLLYAIFRQKRKEKVELSRLLRLFMPGMKFEINIPSIFIRNHNILEGKNYKFTSEQFVSSIERMLESIEEINKYDNPYASTLKVVNYHSTAAQAYARLMVPFVNKEFRLCTNCLENYFRPYGRRQ